MTSACCCGTTRIAREMMMMATTKSAIVKIDEPTHMADASSVESTRANARVPLIGRAAVGKDETRAAGGDDVQRRGARHIGCGELGVPRGATVVDPRGAVGVSDLQAH